MKKSRWSKSYRYYEGRKPGQALAKWLNDPEQGAEFIHKLLTDAQLVWHWVEKYPSAHALHAARRKEKLPPEFWNALERFNDTLASFTHAPHIDPDELSEGERLSWRLVTDESPIALVSAPIRWILQLIDRDAVTRVNECAYVHCGKWYFGTRSDQKFCSPLCRWKAHAETEPFKQKRQEYNREQYLLHKSGKVKQHSKSE